MCGRFVVAKTVGEIMSIFEVDEIVGDQPDISFNVAPTHQISIIVERADEKARMALPSAICTARFTRLAGVSCRAGARMVQLTHRR